MQIIAGKKFADVVDIVCLALYTYDISQTKGKKMANITITMTEAEAHSFIVAKRIMDEMEYSNLDHDEKFGTDMYGKVHEGLNSLQEKVEDQQWIEEWVAEGVAVRPDLSKAFIRKHAKKALKAEKEGSE